MEDDIIHATKVQQDSDASVVECLTDEINIKAERSKHILSALHAASVPLDWLTASVLSELGSNMHALLHAVCES